MHQERFRYRPGRMSEQIQRAEVVRVSRSETPTPGLFGLVLSVLCSAVVLTAVGCVCALIYPVLKELRESRVKGEDGSDQRMLGFWSILFLALVIACVCFTSSLFLIHLDSAHFRTRPPGSAQVSVREQLDYMMAVLNGVMAMFTVIWSLT